MMHAGPYPGVRSVEQLQTDVLPRMTVEEYLKFENAQDVRHEFVDGYVYAMTGAREMHERISLNLASSLNVHLRGTPCRAWKGDLKLAVGKDYY